MVEDNKEVKPIAVEADKIEEITTAEKILESAIPVMKLAMSVKIVSNRATSVVLNVRK